MAKSRNSGAKKGPITLVGVLEADPLSQDHFILLPEPGADHGFRIPKPKPNSNDVQIDRESAPEGEAIVVRIDPKVTIESIQRTPASFFSGSITTNLFHSRTTSARAGLQFGKVPTLTTWLLTTNQP